MLSPNKIIALKMFVHTRLSGNYTEYIDEQDKHVSNVFVEQIVSDTVRDDVLKIYDKLTENNYTVKYLNELPDSVNAYYIYNYYKVMVDVYNSLTVMGKNENDNQVIEGVIGLSLLSMLYDEKGIERDMDFDYMSILNKFESKDTKRRELVFRMHKIAKAIHTALDKANIKLKTVSRQNTKSKRKK